MKSVKILLFFVLLLTSSSFVYAGKTPFQEVLAIRGKATAYEKSKHYKEAMAVYEEGGEKTKDIDNNYLFLKNASEIAAKKLKDPDLALKIAGNIRDKGYAASQQMILLNNQKKYQEVIDKFSDKDISKWPFNCRLESYSVRANAFYKIKKFTEAISDLQEAAKSHGKVIYKGNAANLLGKIYQNELKDDAKAIEAYKKALKITKANYAWRCNSFLNLNNLLIKTGKAEEAIALFKDFDLKKLSNENYKIQFLFAKAKALKAGKYNGQSASTLVKIIQMGSAKKRHKKAAQVLLDELIKEMEK